MQIKQEYIEQFIKSTNAVVVKDTGHTLLLHCIFPHHKDNRRSAVLYKETGLYFCPNCGTHNITKIIGAVQYDYTERKCNRKQCKNEFPVYFIGRDYYYEHDGTLVFANIKNGCIMGTGKRVECKQTAQRKYIFVGECGYRLGARYICESTTDAIRLVDAGVDAGSICSSVNAKNVQPHQVYIPQLDKVGIDTALWLQRKGILVFWWNKLFADEELNGVKDLRDLSLEKFNLILDKIKV